MAEPLKVGLAGLGTVGTAVVQLSGARARQARRALRPSDRGRRRERAFARQEARDRSEEGALGRRSGGACRAIPASTFWSKSSAEQAIRPRARSRPRSPPAKPVVTANKALLAAARPKARDARRTPARGAQFRGVGRRRHPDREDAARGAQRQFVHAHLRHPQRHLQLHPLAHGGGAARLRRLPARGAAARLCRGRSVLRRRGPRHRAEAFHPREPRLRHQSRSRGGLCRGHFVDHARRSRCGGRARLPRQASRRRGAEPTPASSSACIRPWCRRSPPSRR